MVTDPMIISFSLWGDNACYNYGALENALTIPKYYPNAILYFYVDEDTCIPKILKALRSLKHVRVIPSTGVGKASWRFQPAFDEPEKIVLVRDTDSRVGKREVAAVKEWLASNSNFHIMRDNVEGHFSKIMAGMWGVRNGECYKLRDKFEKRRKAKHYFADQFFLAKQIYPHVKDTAFVHDEYFKYDKQRRKFPAKGHFVGAIDCSTPHAFQFLKEKPKTLKRERTESFHPTEYWKMGVF